MNCAQCLSRYDIADYSGITTNSKNKDHLYSVAHGIPEVYYVFSYVT